jgi:hypothetical protein
MYMNSDITDAAGFIKLFTETSFAPSPCGLSLFNYYFSFLLHNWMEAVITHFSILDEWLLQPCCWLIFKLQLDICEKNMCCCSFCQRPECWWVVCCTKLGSTVTVSLHWAHCPLWRTCCTWENILWQIDNASYHVFLYPRVTGTLSHLVPAWQFLIKNTSMTAFSNI